jgi:hypothetical protein
MEFEEHFRHFEASTRNEMRALQDTMTSQEKVMLDMQDTHRMQCAQAKEERMVWYGTLFFNFGYMHHLL